MELHPSSTARVGNIPSNAVRRGLHRDLGPYSANQEVWCRQCGFRCNLGRDERHINQFAGETITSGNVLINGSFEDWTAGAPDDWTLSGSVTQETTSGYFDWRDDGVSSAKIERDGSDISLSQDAVTPSDFNSNTVIFGVRVKSITSEVVRLRIDVNSIEHYSRYNAAQQRFQELSLLVKCPAVISTLTVKVLADSANGIAYVDSATLMRSGAPTTASVFAGCKMCGSYDYY